jgi:hypothetical protein
MSFTLDALRRRLVGFLPFGSGGAPPAAGGADGNAPAGAGTATAQPPQRSASDGQQPPPAGAQRPADSYTAADSGGAGAAPASGAALPARPRRAKGRAAGGAPSGAANGAASRDVGARLLSGDLTASDFQGLKPGKAAETLVALATGSRDQKDNFARLMAEPAFAGHLRSALDGLGAEDRQKVVRSAAEAVRSGSAQGHRAQTTLGVALDSMVASRRNETLRDALLSGDSAVTGAVNAYLEGKPHSGGKTEQAGELLTALSQDRKLDNEKLSIVMEKMSDAALKDGLVGLSAAPDADARQFFQRAAEAVISGRDDRAGTKLRQALDAMPLSERAELLKKVVTDPAGMKPTDQQVNLGQRFVADYLGRQAEQPDKIRDLLGSLSPADRTSFETFIRQNVSSAEVQRLVDPPGGSVDPKKVETADKQAMTLLGSWLSRSDKVNIGRGEQYLRQVKSMTAAEMDQHFGKLDAKQAGKLVDMLSPSELTGIGTDYTDRTRLALIEQVATNGGAKSRATLAAGLAKSFADDKPYFDSNKAAVREQLSKLLENDPNAVLREMRPSELMDVVKTFLHPPPKMEPLQEILGQLTGHSAASLAVAVQNAAKQVGDELKLGNMAGAVLSGFTIGAKAGGGSGLKVGDAKTDGGEIGSSLSGEINIQWSPRFAVEHSKTAEGLAVTEELTKFMGDWTDKLNEMSQNQKAIFRARIDQFSNGPA